MTGMAAAGDSAPEPEKPKPSAPSARRNLLLRIASALVLAPLAISLNYLGGWYAIGFWFTAGVGVWWEWTGLISAAGRRIVFGVGAVALLFASAVAGVGRTRTPIFIVLLGALALGALARSRQRLWVLTGLFYAAGVVLAPVMLIMDATHGFRALVFVLIVVWMTDIFAFFGGRAIGGPKLWPAISPNKTWSGALCGCAAGVAGGLAMASAFELPRLWPLAIIAFALSIASHAGDLFESRLKRIFGVKDSGNLIPGHGGLMDRLDGFVAAVVLAVVIGAGHAGLLNGDMLDGGLRRAAEGLLIW